MSEDGPVDALVESDTGSWVLYSDYDALAAKIAALEAALREGLQIFRAMEKPPGVNNSRTRAWRQQAHGLLHPNDCPAPETVTKPYPAWFGSPTLIDRIDESMERGIPFDLALSECAQWAELRSEAIAKLREYYGSSEYHAYQSKNAAETEGEKKVCPPIHKRRQGENEWVFQQSCQCSRCRNLYEQLVADQEMDKQRREME
jgi:hypothetical protein